jgi:hypothetical protein
MAVSVEMITAGATVQVVDCLCDRYFKQELLAIMLP